MASSQTSAQFSAGRMRLIKDRIARFGVTLGGGLVLLALLLIFFYLLYVVLPIFKGADVKSVESYAVPGGGETLALGMEARAEVGHRVTSDGRIVFFQLREGEGLQTAGSVLLERSLVNDGEEMRAFARNSLANNDYAVALSGGLVRLARPDYDVSWPNDIRLVEPRLTFPFGETPLLLDAQERDIQRFAFERDGNTLLFAAVTADQQLIVSRFTGRQNMMTRAFTFSTQRSEIPLRGRIQSLHITPNLRQLFVQQNNRVHIFDVRNLADVQESQVISLPQSRGAISSIALLAGSSSLMIAHESGDISQWFEVSGEGQRQYREIRTFQVGQPIRALIPEQFRRTFYALTTQGELAIMHTTSHRQLYQRQPGNVAIEQAAIGPRANHLVAQNGDQVHVFRLHNDHPEVSWSAIWSKVWYENYEEPTYTWQSTSGSDEFEPKFSLVPISFGTIKAAFYAMLLAVPIGLAAAVYTAYFMTPALRKVVKPTVEIMEALPTVILGFLAGLWLAPLVESHLPGFIAFVIVVPLTILAAAFLWHLLPEHLRRHVTDGRAAMLLMPVVIFAGWASFAMSPYLELWFFDGDTRYFLTNELGINFDQRNALVVGIAMGFAVIPTIFSIAEDAVFSVPKHLSNGSLALGATEWQTLTKVVLLTASPGIFSAVMMGLGRAVGETMIVLMATGNTPIMDWNIFEGMRTLSANIAVEMPESEVGSTHYRILFLAAFVLFVFTFAFNTLAEFVRQRLREKYSSL